MLVACWNLFLALVPLALGLRLARGISPRKPGDSLSRGAIVALGAGWLLCLPNAPYLMTDVRHFLFDPRWRNITAHGHVSYDAMFASAAWAVGFLSYGMVGLILFWAALRPVERAAKAAGVRTGRWILPLCALVSFGVYLGLIYRFNSWDVLNRPGRIFHSVIATFTRVRSVAAIGLFAIFLWVAHRLLDLVHDAWPARRWLRHGGVENSPAASLAPAPSETETR